MSVDILIPTFQRPAALLVCLSGVAGQSYRPLQVIVAEQSAESARGRPEIKALCRIITARGGTVQWHHRRDRRGIAEQRDFLFRSSSSPAVLYLDDDVYMEPQVVERLSSTRQRHSCAFVGAFPNGLSFVNDERPAQQVVEFWHGAVSPEAVEPGSPEWERAQLHRAANLWHFSRCCRPGEFRAYKVAWVACCVLYDRRKLAEVGAFSFWPELPRYHSGEEVLVQNLLMRRWGGCALMPSGTFHIELPSTVLNAAGTVDGHALELLPRMLERYKLAGKR